MRNTRLPVQIAWQTFPFSPGFFHYIGKNADNMMKR